MAASNETAPGDPETPSKTPERRSFATFDTEPEPEPSPEEAAQSEASQRPKGLLTVLAVLLAAGLAVGGVFAPMDLVGDANITDYLIVGGFGFVIAMGGMLPLRWGWYLVPFVSLAHYGMNFYNIIFADSTVYTFVPGDAYGYSLFVPLIGVVLGYAMQGLYNWIAVE